MPHRQSRRDFLRTSAAGGAVLALPAAVYRGAFAADPPSERIRLGFIGVGNQGRANLRALMKHVVAICDVDLRHVATAGDEVDKARGKFEAFDDYRHLLDR